MPLLTFEGPKLDLEQKRQLVHTLTLAASEAVGLPREIITVIIHENPPENIGAGGELLPDKWARTGKA